MRVVKFVCLAVGEEKTTCDQPDSTAVRVECVAIGKVGMINHIAN